ncbi:MAG TPA: helix-turn-helix transcriptional regulator [Kofleriaceae bacterium]|nr:helix-turn-helix transcriptional regulator [Kofleriaceae bacterium]
MHAWDQTRTAPRSGGERLWPAWLVGQWRLFDAFTAGGARYIVVIRNPEPIAAHRGLGPRERIVLEHVLAGQAGKWIASELKLSESVVARTLRLALDKLGAPDTTTLAGVPVLAFDPLPGVGAEADRAVARIAPAARSLANLSQAERSIATDLFGGKRIPAIALERGTSPRTVAHQISNVYRKLGASSRRELLALLA